MTSTENFMPVDSIKIRARISFLTLSYFTDITRMSPQEQFNHIGRRGTPMAKALGVAIVGLLGGMWIMGRDAKHKEGQASALGSASPWDKDHRAMTSKEVSDTVVVPKPGTDRLGHAAVRKATT
ncbi:hypothetical protein BJ165DRAFT_1475205 [Panaeolus papilionaceus]|nr:hypothetical protein BJ165DRAFT_1475205 [Panaeolus papilionaceus]